MRSPWTPLRPLLAAGGAALALLAAPQPEVRERQLRNGVRVLLVERPGAGAVHASLFARGGRGDTGSLPPGAAELLARSLFGHVLPEDLGKGQPLDELLRREEGAREAVRLERLRQARLGGKGAGSELEDLLVLHQGAMDPLQSKVDAVRTGDALEALGASRREAEAAADYIRYSLDLPAGAFPAWCQLEAARLRLMQMGRFPVERERRIQELDGPAQDERRALSILLSTALPGQPYAQVADEERADLESLTWSAMRVYGRGAFAPSRLCLVLVGGLKAEEAWPVLEASFGALDGSPDNQIRSERVPAEAAEREGSRRLQASIAGEPCLFLGWRVPPAPHPDRFGLDVLARILGDGEASRLQVRLVERGAQARRISVRLGVPGARDTNLLLVEAKPAEGRFLPEIEQALQSEILRLQREPIQEAEVQRAQRLREAEALKVLGDAAALAHALGTAACQAGDWRDAFPPERSYTPAEIQALARRYLVPSRATVAFLEPDLLGSPKDALERDLTRVLQELVRRKVEDPARQEAVVREALKQLRMLAREERLQILKLLEVQVKPS